MNGSYLIDTNIIIKLFANSPEIIEKLKEYSGVLIPVTVIGELYYGAYNSVQIEHNEGIIDSLADKFEIINIDRNTAKVYGQIKAKLKKQGTPIPENDIWIAAAALQFSLPVLTNDKHFSKIDGLEVINL
ncbi:MAG: type II toxin-antitoxin system VapC family toxin [Okeania sp. SIO3C4]|nr:type II toxin-antitoxin system VapC family toxin [Okeania sp. SIO3C4]